MNIFDYLDYRLFLKEFYEERKKTKSFFSYRYMGNKVGMDPGYLVRVMQGRLHIAEASIDKFCALCKLNEKEAAYFSAMVNFAKAKSERQIKLYFEKAPFPQGRQGAADRRIQYEFYQKWYYSAVRALIGFCGFPRQLQRTCRAVEPAHIGVGCEKRRCACSNASSW